MLKSLRKFNKNVFVYPPPLSYQGRGYLAVCVLTYKEREFRGGGLNLVFPGDPPLLIR